MSEDAKKIVAVVGAAVVALGLAVVVGAWLMQGHTVHKMTYREATKQAYPDPTVFATVVGKSTPGLDLDKMFKATPAVLAHGKQLFAACTACHGANGKGDGPAAVALKPPPRNFTSPKGWTRGYNLADIFVTITEGVKGTGMGAFGTLSPEDRFALAHYIESLGKFDHHDHAAAEIASLDARYHLSEGVHAPNKVAVPTVMKHEEAEYAAPRPVEMPPASDTSVGATLCRRLVADPVRAAEVLSELPDWRDDLDVFARAAMADTPRNGFRAAVATLNGAQWKAFHDELVAVTPRPGHDEAGAGRH
ncbi:MAG: cytochrome c [Gemmatimonadetes bacterium]|nr:cytochrome c [Gemmatimonadota bacterium]